MSLIIKQIKLARIAGVPRYTVSKAVKAGSIAVTTDTPPKVDLDNELTQLWIEKQIAKKAKAPIQGKSDPSIGLIALQREKILEEIGKIRADKKLKELQYAQKREVLIEKDTVAAALFQYLDALNVNMLDVPDMIIDSVIDKVSAGASRGDIIKLMRDMIRKAIVNTKKQIKDRLNQTLKTL